MKIILLGAPGSGKGTISELLIKKNNYKHISTGNLFREAIQNQDELSIRIKDILNSGKLVDDNITNEIAKKAILEVHKNTSNFILDGYPRNINQAKFLNNLIDIDKVFYLNIQKEKLLERIVGRRICLNCNTIYNLNTSSKPKVENKCDNCNSVLVQRKDDSLETANKRISLYLEETYPLIEYYTNQNKLIELDVDKDIDLIYKEILEYE